MLTFGWILSGLVIVIAMFFTHHFTYLLGYLSHKADVNKIINAAKKAKESAYENGVVKGEQIGFTKGLEAGRSEEKTSLRQDFIMFLEEQLRLLKNQNGDGKPEEVYAYANDDE